MRSNLILFFLCYFCVLIQSKVKYNRVIVIGEEAKEFFLNAYKININQATIGTYESELESTMKMSFSFWFKTRSIPSSRILKEKKRQLIVQNKTTHNYFGYIMTKTVWDYSKDDFYDKNRYLQGINSGNLLIFHVFGQDNTGIKKDLMSLSYGADEIDFFVGGYSTFIHLENIDILEWMHISVSLDFTRNGPDTKFLMITQKKNMILNRFDSLTGLYFFRPGLFVGGISINPEPSHQKFVCNCWMMNFYWFYNIVFDIKEMLDLRRNYMHPIYVTNFNEASDAPMEYYNKIIESYYLARKYTGVSQPRFYSPLSPAPKYNKKLMSLEFDGRTNQMMLDFGTGIFINNRVDFTISFWFKVDGAGYSVFLFTQLDYQNWKVLQAVIQSNNGDTKLCLFSFDTQQACIPLQLNSWTYFQLSLFLLPDSKIIYFHFISKQINMLPYNLEFRYEGIDTESFNQYPSYFNSNFRKLIVGSAGAGFQGSIKSLRFFMGSFQFKRDLINELHNLNNPCYITLMSPPTYYYDKFLIQNLPIYDECLLCNSDYFQSKDIKICYSNSNLTGCSRSENLQDYRKLIGKCESCNNYCSYPVCGDNKIEGSEQCDDGKNDQTSGCLSDCSGIKDGFNCVTNKNSLGFLSSVCSTLCGNGYKTYDEECDILPIQRGCTYDCKLEPGFFCENRSCDLCSENCLVCGSSSRCASCSAGTNVDGTPFIYYKNSDGKCVKNCQTAYFGNKVSGLCEPCLLDNCEACESPQKCTKCFSPNKLSNGKCLTSCPAKTYITADACIPCVTQNCHLCNSLLTTCLYCVPNYYLYKGECTLECLKEGWVKGQINGVNQCMPCISNCKTCTNNIECVDCFNPYKLDSSKLNCALECPSDETYDSNNKCLKCSNLFPSSNCLTCNSLGCIKCPSQKYLINGSKCGDCPEYTVANVTSGSCVSCDKSCASCTVYGSVTICTKCISGTYLMSKTNGGTICLDKCDIGYFSDSLKNSCVPCSTPDCEICKDSFSICTKCKDLYLDKLTQTCQIHQPSGYYISDSENKVISKCDLSCEECSSLTICSKCNINYFLTDTNKCDNSCPLGFYQNINQRICQKCTIQNCDKCNFLNNNVCNCEKCTNSYYLFDNECVSKCPINSYQAISEGLCVKCKVSNCKCCTSSELTCDLCNDNFFLEDALRRYCYDGGCLVGSGKHSIQITSPQCNLPVLSKIEYCKPCLLSTCRYCGDNFAKCQACPKETVLDISKTNCIPRCLSAQYKRKTTTTMFPAIYASLEAYECDNCPSNCQTCNDFDPICTECISGFSLTTLPAGQTFCTSECESGKYPSNGVCVICGAYCNKCESATTCAICKSLTFLYKGICYSKCPTSTYDNGRGECGDCLLGCNSCTDSFTCLKCNSNLLYYENNKVGSCMSECPDGNYAIDDKCKPCTTVNCKKCEGNVCSKCNDNFLFDEKYCVDSCDSGFISNSTHCVPCDVVKCDKCSYLGLNQVCTKCKSPSLLYLEKECVDSCPPKFFKQNDNCIQCSSNCLECLRSNSCDKCDESLLKYKIQYITVNTVNLYKCDDCGDGYFVEAGFCLKCIPKCLKCKNGTSCDDFSSILVFDPISNSLMSDCPSGSFLPLNTKTCKQCITEFLACVKCHVDLTNTLICDQCGRNPLSISSNLIPFPELKKCVAECSEGYGVKDSLCVKCPNLATKCIFNKDIVQVTECTIPKLILEKTSCIDNCETENGYFIDGKYCNKCTASNCKNCVGVEPLCSKCKSPYFLFIKNNLCVNECPPSSIDKNFYYLDSINEICQKCDFSISNCETCSSNIVCLKCKSGFFLKEDKCVSDCPISNYFKNDLEKKCEKCEVLYCDQCRLDKKTCQKCENDYFLTDKNTCTKECPDGTTIDKAFTRCINCPDKCIKCNNDGFCSVCSDQSFLLDNSKCVESCPNKNYYSDNLQRKCFLCSSNCINCVDSKICQVCDINNKYFLTNYFNCTNKLPDGTFGNLITGKIETCKYSNCKICEELKCSLCENEYFWDDKMISCSKTCSLGYGTSIIKKVCEKCIDPNCFKCDIDQLKCTSCFDSYYLFNNATENKCLRECPDSFYIDFSSKICQKCISGCEKCDTILCNKCESTTHLYYNGECIAKDDNSPCYDCLPENKPCPYRTYYNGTACLNCPQNCQKCLNNTCLSCLKTYNLIKDICIGECQPNEGLFYDYNSDRCIKCSNNCIQCSSLKNCSICEQKFEADHYGQCQPSKGYYINNEGIITRCLLPQNCISCNLTNNCTECNQPFQLEVRSNKCFRCPIRCLNCSFENVCTSCKDSFILNNSADCIPNFKCKSNEYLHHSSIDPILDMPQCKKCGEKCIQCISDSVCQLCESNHEILNNKCTPCGNIPGFNDDCKEKCGDGLLFNKLTSGHECDDGNNKDGDGCDSNCKIEEFYNCTRVDQYSADVCFDTRPMNITIITNPSDSDHIYLLLNRKLKLNDSTDVTDLIDFTIEELNHSNYDYQASYHNARKDYFIDITILYNVSVSRGSASVKLKKNTERILAGSEVISKELLDDYDVPIDDNYYKNALLLSLYPHILMNDKDIKAADAIEKTKEPVSYTIMFATGPLYLLQAFSVFWLMVDAMQIAYFFLYINMIYPENLQKFLQMLIDANLDFFPNPFGKQDKESDEITVLGSPIEDQDAPFRFACLKLTASFFKNAGSQFFLLILLYIVFAIVILTDNHFKKTKKTGKFQVYLGKFREALEYGLVIRINLTVFMQIVLAVALQLRNCSSYNVINILSAIMGVVAFIYISLFLVQLLRLVNRKKAIVIKDPDFKRKYDILFEDYKKLHWDQRNYPIIVLVKKYLMVMALVLLHDWPLYQVSFILLIYFLSLLILCKSLPFERRLTNAVMIFTEIIYITVLCLITFLLVKDREELSSVIIDEEYIEYKIMIGWVMIILITSVMLLYLIVYFRQQIFALIAFYKFLKECKLKYEDQVKNLFKKTKTNMSILKTLNTSKSSVSTDFKEKDLVNDPYDQNNLTSDKINPVFLKPEEMPETSFSKFIKNIKSKESVQYKSQQEIELNPANDRLNTSVDDMSSIEKDKSDQIKNYLKSLKEKKEKDETKKISKFGENKLNKQIE